MKRLVRRDERGVALLLALVFLSVFALWIAAVLSFSQSGLVVSKAARSQAQMRYAVDGTVQTAINKARGALSMGIDNGSACPTYTGTPPSTIPVTCQAEAGSGISNIPTDHPAVAILTLATLASGEVGYEQGSNGTLNVSGGVYVNSTLSFGGSHSVLNVCPPNFPTPPTPCTAPSGGNPNLGTLWVRGNCTGIAGNVIAYETLCNQPASLLGQDPAYPPAQTTGFSNRTAGTCSSYPANLVTLLAGRYTDAAALTALTTACNKLIWFQSGVYYFDFPVASAVWTFGGGAAVVGGEPGNWLPGTPPTPAAFNPVNGCTASSGTGVQFIFGNTSRIEASNTKVAVCAYQPPSGGQQIALYGARVSQGQISAENAPVGSCISKVPYDQADRTTCALLKTNGSQANVLIQGTIYAPLAALDLQLTNIAQVAGRGILVRKLKLQVTGSFSGSAVFSPGFVGTTLTNSARKILFTVTLGTPKLRARVRFDDYDSNGVRIQPSTVTIESWSVVR